MDSDKFVIIAKTMREYGISHVKMGECEFTLSRAMLPLVEEPAPLQVPVDAPAPESEAIKHQVQELSSLLKLDDVDLVDQLFPEPKDPQDEAV